MPGSSLLFRPMCGRSGEISVQESSKSPRKRARGDPDATRIVSFSPAIPGSSGGGSGCPWPDTGGLRSWPGQSSPGETMPGKPDRVEIRRYRQERRQQIGETACLGGAEGFGGANRGWFQRDAWRYLYACSDVEKQGVVPGWQWPRGGAQEGETEGRRDANPQDKQNHHAQRRSMRCALRPGRHFPHVRGMRCPRMGRNSPRTGTIGQRLLWDTRRMRPGLTLPAALRQP